MNLNQPRTIAERGTNMTRTRLTAVLVAVVALGVHAADASAYYHPGTGQWMQRDPGAAAGDPMRVGAAGPAAGGTFIPTDPMGQYRDGMNLYHYVRSNPIRHTDPDGLLIFDVDTWWLVWKMSHSGLTDAEYQEARNILNTGCIGISRLLTGGTGPIAMTSDCYDSLQNAKERRNDNGLARACCQKKDVDGKPGKLKIISMKFWNKDRAGNQLVSAGPGGKVDMTPYWGETQATGDTPRRDPSYMNFDFGYLHETVWDTWWHANNMHDPSNGLQMWTFLSDTWWYDRRADWQSPGLAQVWCVVCNEWKLGPGSGGQGQSNSP
jgi:hypothetical protein